jgi:hypothetical protein
MLESHAREARQVRLDLLLPPGAGVEAELRPGTVALAPGEHRRLRLVVTVRGPAGTTTATLRAVSDGQPPLTRTSQLQLVVPEPP